MENFENNWVYQNMLSYSYSAGPSSLSWKTLYLSLFTLIQTWSNKVIQKLKFYTIPFSPNYYALMFITDKMTVTEKNKNPMRDVCIAKLCLNICVGESGDKLTRAAKASHKCKF